MVSLSSSSGTRVYETEFARRLTWRIEFFRTTAGFIARMWL
jgi:hypothetical protein